MKEIVDIIKAYDIAIKQKKRAALVTVVRIEGSSYRRPGARMLVTDDGRLTGAISGGCLEGDALRKAMSAINTNAKRLVSYDTTDEDDAKFGIQLGCNGIVHVLFEPISHVDANNPIILLRRSIEFRSPSTIITLFSLNNAQFQLGTFLCKNQVCLYINEAVKLADTIEANLKLLAETAPVKYDVQFTTYHTENGVLTALIEYVYPSLHLVICGAGNDVIPLSQMAEILGWTVTIIDGRPTHATSQRFPNAEIIVAKAPTAITLMPMTNNTYYILMTHNYNYDLEILRYLLNTQAKYIGVLGPKSKLKRMLDELSNDGVKLSENQYQKVYGPVGLDIGAETAEEIALSITAEIKAVFSGQNPTFLREKLGPIHSNQ